MPASIVLTGLSATDPVPGAYLEILFAQGEAAGSGSPIEVLLMGNKLAAGTATVDAVVYGPDTIVQMQTEQDVIALFGEGSELHRMFRRFVRVNRDTTVRAIAVTESGGVAASGTVTVANAATGQGTIRVYVHDEFVEVSVNTGDAAIAIATAIVAEINKQTAWGVTAANGGGTLAIVTITAKQKGPRGNFIRYMATITAGIATTVTATTDTALAGGTTADNNAAALATINTQRFYYIVSAAEDATQLGALVTQVGLQAAPTTTGSRQRVIAGSTDTLANATTIATGRNSARADIMWAEKSPWTPAELAANLAACITLFETKPNPRTNWCNFGQDPQTQPYWVVPGPRLASAIPSRTSIKSALNNGLSPIGVSPNGATYLVNLITSRSLNGAQNDYRIRAHHKVTICDFFGDDALAKTVLQFSGKRIANDPTRGQKAPGPSVVTPIIYRGALFKLLELYDDNDLLQDLQKIKDGTVVQREVTPSTRMSARIPIRPIDNAEQFAISVAQVA